MDVETARRLKETIKVLAIVRLVPPFTYEGTFYAKPTFDKPNEYFVRYHYLNTELIELWAYDKISGRVLQKKRPG